MAQRSSETHVEVIGQGAGVDDDLVEDRVVVVAKQDVVAHRGVLDPGLLRRQAEAGLPLGDEDDAAQPDGKGERGRGQMEVNTQHLGWLKAFFGFACEAQGAEERCLQS